MKKEPVFLHSLFRTGSTYLFSKFRNNKNYYCYYEPLHRSIIDLKGDIEYLSKIPKSEPNLGHPTLNAPYFYEYIQLLQRYSKLPFKKEFSFDEYDKNENNESLKEYLDLLINFPPNETPLLQFNRTSWRQRWFRETYPNSINIYLFRNPRDQFESYIRLSEKGAPGFLAMDLLLAGKLKDTKLLEPLLQEIDLYCISDNVYFNEQIIYQIIQNAYSSAEKYTVFFYIYIISLIFGIKNSQFLLNINLFKNKEARSQFNTFLESNQYPQINLDDFDINCYDTYRLSSIEYESIENRVLNIIVKKLTNSLQINDELILELINQLSSFELNIKIPSQQKIFPIKQPESHNAKIIQLIAEEIIKQKKSITTLINERDNLSKDVTKLRTITADTELLNTLLKQQKSDLEEKIANMQKARFFGITYYLNQIIKQILGKPK